MCLFGPIGRCCVVMRSRIEGTCRKTAASTGTTAGFPPCNLIGPNEQLRGRADYLEEQLEALVKYTYACIQCQYSIRQLFLNQREQKSLPRRHEGLCCCGESGAWRFVDFRFLGSPIDPGGAAPTLSAKCVHWRKQKAPPSEPFLFAVLKYPTFLFHQ